MPLSLRSFPAKSSGDSAMKGGGLEVKPKWVTIWYTLPIVFQPILSIIIVETSRPHIPCPDNKQTSPAAYIPPWLENPSLCPIQTK
jgi:hypothetical protein